jgi:hypothetical protein
MTVADGAGAAAGGATSNRTLAERLGQWLDWTDAITLSAALNGTPTTARASLDAVTPSAASALVDDAARVRSRLAQAIATEELFLAGQAGQPDRPTDFATYRRAYLAHQRTMAARLGPLRGRVRAVLAAVSAPLQRLAALDAAMDEALAAREGHLLAKVPVMLERHFLRLRQAQAERAVESEAPGSVGWRPPSAAWLAEFVQDMQAVLLAELELRWQPVEAMMEAMREASANEATRQP